MIIEFEGVNIHARENNKASEQILHDQHDKLVGQCKTVFEAMKRGERLSVATAMNSYHIGDLRARVRDLRNSGYQVADKMIGNGFKEYFIEQFQPYFKNEFITSNK